MPPPGPARAFLSYAHEDHKWRDRLLKQLGWLIASEQLDAFHDRKLEPGQQWDGRIRDELQAAQIVIVLMSPDFLGSRYCLLAELVPAIDRHGKGLADLVPVVCDAVDLAGTPLAPLQCLPQDPETNDLKPLR